MLGSPVSDYHGSVEVRDDGSGGDSSDDRDDCGTSPPLEADSELKFSGTKIVVSGTAIGYRGCSDGGSGTYPVSAVGSGPEWPKRRGKCRRLCGR